MPLKYIIGIIFGMIIGVFFYYHLVFLPAGCLPKGAEGIAEFVKTKKHQALKIPQTKFLLVGGSSVGMGISAQLMTDEIGVPTYNFSFWGSLGAEYILHLAKKVLKKGDTALLCLEYEILDWGGKSKFWTDESFIRFVIGTDPDFIMGKSIHEKIWIAASVSPASALSGLKTLFKETFIKKTDTQSPVPVFDEFGDSLFDKDKLSHRNHFKTKIQRVSKAYLYEFQNIPKAAPALGNFLKWSNHNGVHVIATFPNLAQNERYTTERAFAIDSKIRSFYNELGVAVIGTPSDAMFPQDMYFDTNYHLMVHGINKRTNLLIKKIGLEFDK
jgi:hypothetical protein